MSSQANSTKSLEMRKHLSCSNSYRKLERKEISQTLPMRSPSYNNCYIFFLDWSFDHYVVSFLTSHADAKTRKRYHKKREKYRPVSLMDIDTIILTKMLASRIQEHTKRIIYHDQVQFVPGMLGLLNIHRLFNIYNVIDCINKLKIIWKSQ